MDNTAENVKIPTIKPAAAAIKRLMDIILSVVGLIVFSPVLLLIALLIKIDSEGPVFFIQERFGKDGKRFKILKFRSMGKEAESKLGELIDIEALEEPVFKIINDPRVTRFGRFLRRTKLDELPQFINVLIGDMSMVGPRPEETEMAKRYNPWQRTRLLMKPGITGPVQISGIENLPLRTRVAMDEDYIMNYTSMRDIEILLRTIPSIIRGPRLYEDTNE